MEKTDQKIPTDRKNGLSKSLKENGITIITVLDLSHRKITNIRDGDFPPALTELNLSNNELRCVPTPLLSLKCLRKLDLSSNNIDYFDETPEFCHTIEKLNLSKNLLKGPPFWVWSENPKNLVELDISSNGCMKNSLDTAYFNELLQFKTGLSIVNMNSCRLTTQFNLLETFPKVKDLDLSSGNLLFSNSFSEVPFTGLDKCCDIERLNLSYTWLSYINSNIDMFKNLIEINLSENNISNVPLEFCNLVNLEVCNLSFNIIMYLPDDIVKLKKLTALSVAGNKLCMLPHRMHELENLIKLDVYDNYLYDIPEHLDRYKEVDVAQNYLDEPDDEEYKEKRKALRSYLTERIDGRKFEITKPESVSSSRSIDEELQYTDHDSQQNDDGEQAGDDTNRQLSSPEDWDSDDYWVPHFPRLTTPPQSPWLLFVKRKMAEGNFCPMDIHAVPVIEEVNYERQCNPYIFKECDGQFDDLSDDNS